MIAIWREFEELKEKYPKEYEIMLFMLRSGLQVKKVVTKRKERFVIACNGAIIQDTKIASVTATDRRTVESTAELIGTNPDLFKIFSNISSIAFLRDVAPILGLDVIIIEAQDPTKPGIVAKVTEKLKGIPIRQLVAEDPYLAANEPKLTIITDKKIPDDLKSEIYALPEVKRISKPEERE